jgi:hypothetical protein
MRKRNLSVLLVYIVVGFGCVLGIPLLVLKSRQQAGLDGIAKSILKYCAQRIMDYNQRLYGTFQCDLEGFGSELERQITYLPDRQFQVEIRSKSGRWFVFDSRSGQIK